MKSVASRLMKIATYSLIAGVFLFMASGATFAQAPASDVLKGAAKEGAKEMLGVDQPVQGRTEMMDGAKKMLNGRKMLKDDLVKAKKVKETDTLEGGKMMSDGHDMLVEGDKLLEAKKTVEGKKKMLDGAKMMMDGKKKMLTDLTKKDMIKAGKASEGETVMDDGEKMLKKGENMMLK